MCFVGGAIEPGESQEDAVVREFREEVGGQVRPVRLIWEYTRPDGKLHLYWWLAELETGELQANPGRSGRDPLVYGGGGRSAARRTAQ